MFEWNAISWGVSKVLSLDVVICGVLLSFVSDLTGPLGSEKRKEPLPSPFLFPSNHPDEFCSTHESALRTSTQINQLDWLRICPLSG